MRFALIASLCLACAGNVPMSSAAERRICAASSPPHGFVVTDRRWSAGECGEGSPSRPNVQVLHRHDTLPIGSRLRICAGEPIPAGWQTLQRHWRARSGCRRMHGPKHPNVVEVLKVAAVSASGAPCEPRVEWERGGIRLRPHRDAFETCTIDEDTYAGLVRVGLDLAAARGTIEWVALGRAVHYPWLSSIIIEAALRDPEWDAASGRPRRGTPSAYVESRLMAPSARARLAAPLLGSGHRLVGINAEKVLISPLREHVAGGDGRRVPFDAQVWLVLGAGR